ncbi:MAG TPA: hypothetical protein VMJ34_14080 [Bryobacteraceae bacterium]|nr:hypothetical protein [Bryobacteraceae bacterium]
MTGPQSSPLAPRVLDSARVAAFSVHGYGFTLTGNCEFALGGLAEDFGYFAEHRETAQQTARAVTLELIEHLPDYDGLPACDAAVYTPRNVVYRHQGKRIVDFGGCGLGVYDAAAGHFRVVSADPHLVYEAAYLFLLSQIGQAADARRLHRLHALAMSHHGCSVLVLLPMGGGKSTLASALLKHSSMSILSDDSPFIDRNGNAFAFPLRLGMLKGSEHEIPPEHRRLIKRMEFGPKYLVNYSWFADRVADRAAPGIVLLGRRTLAPEGRVEPASYRTAMAGMIPNMVVGLGLFQGLEYLLERSTRELAGNVGLGWSRLRNAHALVRRSKNYLFHMGRDSEANARMVMDLAERCLADPA